MPKAYFLTKSEPGTYSFGELVRDGETCWDGVRNYQARNHIREMKKGDRVLYYHSGMERAVVGVAEVTRAAYPDPTDPTEKFDAVDVKPVRTLTTPVTLGQIKDTPALANMVLVRHTRLSVMPVTKAQFDTIIKLGGKQTQQRGDTR